MFLKTKSEFFIIEIF